MSKKVEFSTILIILILLSIIIFSPQITDYFQGMLAITGRASGSYELNVTVGNVAPKIMDINFTNPPNTDVNAGTYKQINSSVIVCDQDQQNSVLKVYGNYTGEADFFDANISCIKTAWTNTTCVLFNCSTNIWSWYKTGVYNYSFNATDGTDWAYSNSSMHKRNWTLGSTTAMVIHPANISWSSLNIDSWNNTADGDPVVVNNTGNTNISYGNVNITGYDLKGESTKTEYIPGINFTAALGTHATLKVECGNWTNNGTSIQNATSTNIAGSMLPRGNFTKNDGSTGQEQLYFCLVHVGASNMISTQSYSSEAYATAQSWVIGIT